VVEVEEDSAVQLCQASSEVVSLEETASKKGYDSGYCNGAALTTRCILVYQVQGQTQKGHSKKQRIKSHNFTAGKIEYYYFTNSPDVMNLAGLCQVPYAQEPFVICVP